MRKYFVCFLFILQNGLVWGETETSRFYKALHAFTYPVYRCSDQDVILDFSYDANRRDEASSHFEWDVMLLTNREVFGF